ncbi:MAG: cellulose biosynthesis protein BcsQ [Pararobbsia sp.]
MKTIAVVSAKGGVGKTTLAAHLASTLAQRAQRVVVLDLDPQNALRLHLGMPLDVIDGVSRATLGDAAWRSVLFDGIGKVGVLPYGVLDEDDRETFEHVVEHDPDWLRGGLADLCLGADDWLLIDTPPGSTIYLRASLRVCDFALNVVLADAASYAVIPTMDRLVAAHAAPRPAFRGVGYVVNQVDQSRQLSRDVVRVLRASLGESLFPGLIHLDQGVGEALAHGTTVDHYDPHCQATHDVAECAQWLMHRYHAGARALAPPVAARV